MNNIDFRITNDGSLGLYNKEVDDIYHASSGAYSESYEKFFLPSNFKELYFKNDIIKVLDICYGIGYNTKTAINEFIRNFENTNKKIYITSIEPNQNLVYLSPFVKVPQYNVSTKDLTFYFILNQFKQEFCEFIISEYKNKYYYNYLDNNLYSYKDSLSLHNIYYQDNSICMKNKLLSQLLKQINITYIIDDARNFLKKNKAIYDIIYLDAFTPLKSPKLWTYEFIQYLKKYMHFESKLITYSISSSYRHALFNNGFFIGNILNKDNKTIGTLASLNKDLIKYPLNEYELGLLKTRCGVMFHDKDLNLEDKEIIFNRELYIKNNSHIMSTSSYIKQHKGTKKWKNMM